MVNQRIVNSNGFVEDNWLAAYVVINQANNVLANLKLATNDDEKSRWEGEAKFLRGLVYFDLVRLYGKSWNDGDPGTNLGVPIVLTPTTSVDESAKVARATVKQTYEQAIKDLTDAKPFCRRIIVFMPINMRRRLFWPAYICNRAIMKKPVMRLMT
jgi:hypothetical protein